MSDWTFPLGAPDDPRRDLPVFSVMPNWKNGVTEQISWLTEVLASERAAEQRRPLRLSPRRTFEAGFLRTTSDRSRLDLFLAGTGKKQCLVPLWHEQVEMEPNWNDSGVVQLPSGSLAMREFRVGDLVLITTGDSTRYAILTVIQANMENDSLQLYAHEDIGPWPTASRIYPLRVARVLDQAKLQSVTDRVGMTQIRFSLSDPDHWVQPGFGNTAKIWLFKPNRIDTIDMDYFRTDFTIDYDVGKVAVVDPSNQVQTIQAMSVRFFGRADIYKFRQFLYKARGKLHGFFVPTFTYDLVPVGDIPAGTHLTCELNGFVEYIKEPQDARTMLMIEFNDGRPQLFATIGNAEHVLDSVPPYRPVAERFTFIEGDGFDEVILKKDVMRISFMAFSRFDQDVFEVVHHAADAVAMSSKVMTRPIISVDADLPETPGSGGGIAPPKPLAPTPPVQPPEPVHIPTLIRKFRTLQTDSKPTEGGGTDYRYGFFTADIDEQGNGEYTLLYQDEFFLYTPSGQPFGKDDTDLAIRIQDGNPIDTNPHCFAYVGETFRKRVGEVTAPGGIYWEVQYNTKDYWIGDYVNDFNAIEAAKDAQNQANSIAYQAAMLAYYQALAYYPTMYAAYLVELAAWEAAWGGV